MFKDRAKRIEMFEGGAWGTGTQMAQLAVDGVHLVVYWDHTTSRYSPMMIGGESKWVKLYFKRWVDQNPARIGQCTSPDTILDAFYEFYRQERLGGG
jgi:hypothetical protein